MSMKTSKSRMVNASTFAAWWMRLSTIIEEKPDDDGAYNLMKILYEAGRRSGATEPVILPKGQKSDTIVDTFHWAWRLAPSFDWLDGEIGFTGLNVDAETLIETLVSATGIEEHETNDVPHFTERNEEKK